MSNEEILQILKNVGAFLKGHFILSSGKHADGYVQCALLFQKPAIAEQLCHALAAKIPPLSDPNTCIISPALGGMIFGYELARHLKTDALFVERTGGTSFSLRRGFTIKPGQPCIIAEDVVTTGKSVRETMAVVEAHGGKVVSVASLINRSGIEQPFDTIPLHSLVSLTLETYEANALPPYLASIPAVKHGSRTTV